MEVLNKETDSRKRKKMLAMKKKMNNLTREQLKAAIDKKKQCNAKAMIIVERLIEPQVEEIWLLENLFHINQTHYQDAVEERAIMKSCGYPLCDSCLDNVPKKQFHISTKQNKVFDITERKNYCSNVCYKASSYLKDQLYTSPLWLRDCEDIVEFKLFSSINKMGSTGVEIDLGNISPIKTEDFDCNINKEVEITEDKFEQITNHSPSKVEWETKSHQNPVIEPQSNNMTHSNSVAKDDKHPVTAVSECIIEKKQVSKTRETEEKKHKKKRRAVDSSTPSRKEERMYSVGLRVERYLDSWFTIDSLRFLYGDEKLKEIFEEFGTPFDRFGQFINTKDAFIYERYAQICKRLNFIELKERIEQREILPSKPLPDYEVLKKEARDLEIKVRSFYLGDKVSFKTVEQKEEEENEISSYGKKSENVHHHQEEGVRDTPSVLPLIDNHSILATRRRIVLDKIYKTLPDILSALGLAQFNVRHEVQEFVHTLSLNASNVTMTPSEWNLISIVLIKLFTLRNELLNYAFTTDLTQKRIINLLLSYRLDLDYLQKCVNKLSNIHQIIKNSDGYL